MKTDYENSKSSKNWSKKVKKAVDKVKKTCYYNKVACESDDRNLDN